VTRTRKLNERHGDEPLKFDDGTTLKPGEAKEVDESATIPGGLSVPELIEDGWLEEVPEEVEKGITAEALGRPEKPEAPPAEEAEMEARERGVLIEGKEVEYEGERFRIYEEEGATMVANVDEDTEYEIFPLAPSCECKDFQIRVLERGEKERCKHLEVAEEAGYTVGKIRTPETVSLEGIEEVSKPSVILESEDQAVELLKQILGPNPKKEDVIAEVKDRKGNILFEEINADVIKSLANAIGIRVKVIERDNQVQKVKIADELEPIEVVVKSRIVAIAGFLDEGGKPRVQTGTKSEVMTPSRLDDLKSRGSNFVEVTCESKAQKKAILNALPVTAGGLKRKIKMAYGWR